MTPRMRASGLALALGILAWGPPAAAQESRTVALTRELVDLLGQRKLDAAAARLGETEFAAILFIPGVQILAISAEYTAPALLNEKIINRNYRDVYLDLASASVPATKVFIEDMDADGLRADRRRDDAFDVYTKGTGAGVAFDGKPRDANLSEEEYRQTFGEAEAAYIRILEGLLAELRRPS